MRSNTERSIDQREYLKDFMPELRDSDYYQAPHIVQIIHRTSTNRSTRVEMSREQAEHLATELTNWLEQNPEDNTNE